MRPSFLAAAGLVVALAVTPRAMQAIDAGVRGEAQVTPTQHLELRGALEGNVSGTLHVTLRWDGSPQAVGHWRLSIEAAQPDGSFAETGSLSGVVTDGVIGAAAPEAGPVLSNLALVVNEGSGQQSAVTAGSGRLDVRLGRAGEPFSGNLALTF